MLNEALFHRLCHIFPASGLTDLKVGVRDGAIEASAMEEVDAVSSSPSSSSPRASPDRPSAESIFFFQSAPDAGLPFPRNGFFGVHPDAGRYRANLDVFHRVMATQPVVGPIPLTTVEAFLSLANCNRAYLERTGRAKRLGGAVDGGEVREGGTAAGQPREAGASVVDYGRARLLYINCIQLSRDESAVQMLEIIGRRASSVTFCSTDDETSGLVPEPLRRLVAESLAGLALIACHERNMQQGVGYATAALFKHPCVLPFVNCARLVALSRNDIPGILMLTEMVLLPFFLRSRDPVIRGLFEVEMGIWDRRTRASLRCLPQQLVATSESMTARFSGEHRIVRAKYIDGGFVEKLCLLCGKGTRGEKLHRCAGCHKAYYCGRICQAADWQRHRARDGCQPRRGAAEEVASGPV